MRATQHLDTRPVLTRTLAAAAASALLLTACGTSGASGGDGARTGDGLDGTYVLEGGTGPSGQVPLVATAPVTLQIEGASWGGTSACNNYGAEVEVDGDRVTLGSLAVTEMACVDAEVMASEQAYLAALQAVDEVSSEGDRLVLTGPDTELTFSRQGAEPDRALVGPRWALTELIDGEGPDGAVTSVAADAELELSDDGRLAGSTGCNRLMGGYTRDGELLTLDGPLATTRMACVDQAVAAQERHVLAVLDAGPLVVEVTGDRLTLTATDGRGLGYRAE